MDQKPDRPKINGVSVSYFCLSGCSGFARMGLPLAMGIGRAT